jgi:hypothetical protein
VIVKRIITAISFALLACSAFAQPSGPNPLSPLESLNPGLYDPLDVRDPLMDPASGGASLPDPGSTDGSRMPEDMQPRPLPGERTPLVGEPFLGRPQYEGPRPYWENDPLFTTPAP